MINIQQLNTDLREIEDRIREVKTALRSTWTEPMSKFQYELITLKSRATERYILRAWVRNRCHIKDAPDYCKEVAERTQAQYAVAA